MVHEVPGQAAFFSKLRESIKPEGKLLTIESGGHVSQAQFEETVAAAKNV